MGTTILLGASRFPPGSLADGAWVYRECALCSASIDCDKVAICHLFGNLNGANFFCCGGSVAMW